MQNPTEQPTPAAADPATLAKKINWNGPEARTKDPYLSPEDLDAILGLAPVGVAYLEHNRVSLHIEKILEPRADIKRCLTTLDNPAITKAEYDATVTTLAHNVARWRMQFGHPLRVPLQRVIILPERFFRNPKLRRRLLQVVEEQITVQHANGHGDFGPQKGQDIWQRFLTEYMDHVRALQPPSNSSTPPRWWRQLLSYGAAAIRRCKAWWSGATPAKRSTPGVAAALR